LAEVPAIYQRLVEEPDSVTNAIRFLILTATRLRETLDCRWEEISFETATWTIPPARNKVGREFEIPLSSEALAILKTQAERRCSSCVFPGRHGSPFASSTIAPILQRVGRTDSTPHGFRSSFRDYCGEIGDVPRHIAEHALNHVIGGTEGAYRAGGAA
jgi:integrase